MGRAGPLCPGISDVNLFRYGQGIIYFDTQISHRAFDLGVVEKLVLVQAWREAGS